MTYYHILQFPEKLPYSILPYLWKISKTSPYWNHHISVWWHLILPHKKNRRLWALENYINVALHLYPTVPPPQSTSLSLVSGIPNQEYKDIAKSVFYLLKEFAKRFTVSKFTKDSNNLYREKNENHKRFLINYKQLCNSLQYFEPFVSAKQSQL